MVEKNNIKPESPKPKRRRRWPWILLGIIILLFAGIRISLQSDWLFGIIKTQAEQAVHEATGAEFTIGSLRGDLLRFVEMTDAELAKNDPVVKLDTLEVRFNIWALFSRTIDITSVRISGLDVHLEQQADSTWNFMELIGDADPDEDVEPSDFPFTLKLQHITLDNSRIQIHAPYLLPDDKLLIDEIRAEAGLTYSQDHISAGLDQLAFKIVEGRLPEPIAFETSASYDNDLITLDRLLISTGRSALGAEGRFDLETDELRADIEDTHISRADLATYLDDIPEFETARITLSADGSLSDLEAGFELHAPGLIKAGLTARLATEPELQLSYLELELDELNLQALTGDPDLDADAGKLRLTVEGTIPLDRYQEAVADIRIELNTARFEHISLADLRLDAKLDQSELEADLRVLSAGEPIEIAAGLRQIWSEKPEWNLTGTIRNLNPAYYAQDPELEGRINMDFEVSGTGTEPHAEPWTYSLRIPDPVIMEYDQLGRISLDGNLTHRNLSSDLHMDSPGGSIHLSALVQGWQEAVPEWVVTLETSDLDLSVIANLEDLPTLINMEAELEGRGTDPETDLRFELSTRLQNSRVLEEPFDKLDAEITFENQIVYLHNVELESQFVNGTAEGRQSVTDFTDAENRLDFDFEIGNLESFAGIAGADTLHASGRLNGRLRPVNGTPVLESELRIEPLVFDDLLVSAIEGHFTALLSETPEIEIDITLQSPSYGDFKLQDIHLVNSTVLGDDEITGDFDFRLIRTSSYGLFHKASFSIAEEIVLNTTELNLVEDGFALELEAPFSVRISGEGDQQTVRMDTLSMRSDDEARMQLHAMTGPGNLIEGWINATRLNLGAMQDVLLDERIADLYFNGSVDFRLENETLVADIDTELSDINYNGLSFDSYQLTLQIEENRMQIETQLIHEDDRLMQGSFSLPFRLGDPETFPDAFYDEYVDGSLELNPLDITRFESFLEQAGFSGLSGMLAIETRLGGTAGKPELEARIELSDANVSGVSIEEAWLDFTYLNEDAELMVESGVRSLGQMAAQLEGTLPLFIDMRTFTVLEPDDNEGVQMSVNTYDFDVSVFNEFIDRDVARNLRGKLNADIDITGTAGSPEPRGSVTFTEGRIQLVENNIALSNIRADIALEPDRINIRDISAESSGSFSLNGDIYLDNFFPDRFDIQARMRNFRVSNTRDLDVYVSLDSRLQDTFESPRLTGSLTVERGYIFLDNFGERQVEQVILEDEEEPDTFAQDFFDSLSMEVNLAVTRRFFIRNRSNPELNLALEGSIDAVKEPAGDLQLFGDINTVRGTATTLGRRFELDEGVIIFSGPADNPEFDIQLSYRVRREDDIRIIYRISGDVEEPEFTFDSEPEMELQDIISYTLFGRPFHALQSWEQGVSGNASAGDAVADAALDLLLDRLQTLAADRLGVDVVEVETSSQSGGGTRVKAGKFLSDRLFVALVQELGSDPNSQVIIEYLLRRNLELIFTGSDDFRTGVDVLWKLDY